MHLREKYKKKDLRANASAPAQKSCDRSPGIRHQTGNFPDGMLTADMYYSLLRGAIITGRMFDVKQLRARFDIKISIKNLSILYN